MPRHEPWDPEMHYDLRISRNSERSMSEEGSSA